MHVTRAYRESHAYPPWLSRGAAGGFVGEVGGFVGEPGLAGEGVTSAPADGMSAVRDAEEVAGAPALELSKTHVEEFARSSLMSERRKSNKPR